jgi:carbon storage regulator
MLVLRRKVGESIVLAGVINVSVLAVEGERVKIGISAPPDVSIVREELLRISEPAPEPVPPEDTPTNSLPQSSPAVPAQPHIH